MAVTAGMDFSTLTRVPGGGADEAASSLASPAPAGVPGDSFDSLMNSLLAAPRAQGAATAGDVPRDPLPGEGDLPGNPDDPFIATAIGAEVAGEVCAGAVPSNARSAETFLPPDGRALPSDSTGSPAVDSAGLPMEVGQGGDGEDVLPCTGDVPAVFPEAPVATTDPERPRAAEDEVSVAIAVPGNGAPVPMHSGAVVPVDDEVHADAATESVRLPGAASVTTPLPASRTPVTSNNGSAPVTAPVAITPASVAAPEAARDTTALRADVSARMETTAPAMPSAATPDVGARLQELLARLGSNDGASPLRREAIHALLRDPEGGAPANTAALTYAQAGAAVQSRGDVPVPGPALHTPLRHPEWSDELGQRIRWALGNQIQSAELKINPPQLGPLEIRVSVDADRQMNVTLSSQHALVRESLQDSLPRLRDLMSEQGFGAVNVDVSQHSLSDGGRSSTRQPGTESAAHAGPGPADDAAGRDADRPREIRGLVDLYA